MSKIQFMIECETGKIAILDRAIAGLVQAAKDEQVFTLLEGYSPHYEHTIAKLTRTRSLTLAKLALLQAADQLG